MPGSFLWMIVHDRTEMLYTTIEPRWAGELGKENWSFSHHLKKWAVFCFAASFVSLVLRCYKRSKQKSWKGHASVQKAPYRHTDGLRS